MIQAGGARMQPGRGARTRRPGVVRNRPFRGPEHRCRSRQRRRRVRRRPGRPRHVIKPWAATSTRSTPGLAVSGGSCVDPEQDDRRRVGAGDAVGQLRIAAEQVLVGDHPVGSAPWTPRTGPCTAIEEGGAVLTSSGMARPTVADGSRRVGPPLGRASTCPSIRFVPRRAPSRAPAACRCRARSPSHDSRVGPHARGLRSASSQSA